MACPTVEAIRALPKVEIHAHLSGSITQKKLIELLDKRGKGETFTPFDCRIDVSNALKKCFDYFDKVAKVVQDLATLKETSLHVFDTFAEENCVYFEVRTSPKTFKLPSGESTTKLQYLETINEALTEFQGYSQERFGFVMEVKVLLSVDRGKVNCKEDALAQIDDILEMRKKYPDLVIGVDVCGNPSKMSAEPYIIPALLERKENFQNFPITYHAGEVPCDSECQLMLEKMGELNIRRLGHCSFLPDSVREAILKGGIHKDGGKIGIEICPTSNLVTKELDSLEKHHWPDYWKKSDQVLISINTDDSGLFSCDLTSENFDMAKVFNLSMDDLISIQRQALESSFHPNKAKLLEQFDARLQKLDKESTKEPPTKVAKKA